MKFCYEITRKGFLQQLPFKGEVRSLLYVDCAKGTLLQNQDIPKDPNSTDGAAPPPAIFYPGVFTGSNAGH
jgi:hypothetical protein